MLMGNAMLEPRVTLAIRDLRASFRGRRGMKEALKGVTLHLRAGEKVALVGESGSGKSVTARLVFGLLQGTRNISVSGSISIEGVEVIHGGRGVEKLRGNQITMIFQDPSSSLNPVFKIHDQFQQVLRSKYRRISRKSAALMAEAALRDVQIEDPKRVLDSYPFQLSGGMNQRVMIAMALINRPSLLVADEPGTALDVTIQAETLALMHDLTEKLGTAVLLISHNLAVVREFCDRVYVLYDGQLVEHGSTAQIFSNPRHPYTRALMSAAPGIIGKVLPNIPDRSPEFFQPLIVHPGCGEPHEVGSFV